MKEMKAAHEKQFRRARFRPPEEVVQQAKQSFESEWGTIRQLEQLRHELAEGLAARGRREDYLRGQLHSLYGPLSFLIEANARCFEHGENLRKLSLEVNPNCDPKGPNVSGALECWERYRTQIAKNNSDALSLLGRSWGWLDQEDVSDVGAFLLDIYRAGIEDGVTIPIEFYMTNRTIPLMPAMLIRNEFIDRIRRRVTEKQAELSGLQRPTNEKG